MKAMIRCAAFVLLAIPLFAGAVEINKSVATCLDPSEPRVSVASEIEKKGIACRRWSEFTFLSANVDNPRRFVMRQCGNAALRPVNEYAKFVIDSFRARYGLPALEDAPTTWKLYNQFSELGLRELRDGESRENSLAVWGKLKVDGMVGVVYQDQSPGGKVALDKLFIHYPGKAYDAKDCGEVIDASAAVALQKHALKSLKPKFLTVAAPSMYWNYWVKGVGGEEAPAQLDPGTTYEFRISLSSVDYASWIAGSDPKQRRGKLSEEVASNVIPEMDRMGYRITILAPNSLLLAPMQKTFDVRPSEDKLRKSLTAPPSRELAREQLALQHDAIERKEEGVPPKWPSGIKFNFTPSNKAPCESFVILVQDQTGRLVSSWSHTFRINDGTNAVCNLSAATSRRVDVVSLFDVPIERSDAQLGFMEFKDPNRTIGFYAEGNSAPLIWDLATERLTPVLVDHAREINEQILKTSFSLDKWANELYGKMFTCDGECDGPKAQKRVVALANSPTRKRLQVSLRDAANTRNYLPANLMALPDAKLLGQRVDVVQHLPRAAIDRPDECVKPLSGSFLIKAADDTLRPTWRENWWSGLVPDPAKHVGFESLSQYLKVKQVPKSSEGLFVLAHHGPSGMSDASSGGNMLRPGDILRTFGRSSFAVLAMCSVGAPSAGGDQTTVLDRLNSQNIRAVIASPYSVPLDSAKIFLMSFRNELKDGKSGRTLREIFNGAVDAIRSGKNPDFDFGISTVDTFMLLGDGDVKVCK